MAWQRHNYPSEFARAQGRCRELAVGLSEDGFPVAEGRLLAIPRRHVADYFDLHQPERNADQRLLEEGRQLTLDRIKMLRNSTSVSTQAKPQDQQSSIATFT